ncbi:hypothetical protein ACPYO6_00340 [Georgenia sp. Z1344]|uniref:hypothetical protein n=1 Tax=Georgenia sp. Z1344 TaxID=3416706 RepID=UPI003CF2018E
MGKRAEATTDAPADATSAAAEPTTGTDTPDPVQTEQARTALRTLTSGDDPLTVLDGARRLRENAETIEADAVRAARAAGVSWSKIGAVYGLTKQGAQQRFSPKNADKRARSDGTHGS